MTSVRPPSGPGGRARKKSAKKRKDKSGALGDSLPPQQRDSSPMFFGEIPAIKPSSTDFVFLGERKPSIGAGKNGDRPPSMPAVQAARNSVTSLVEMPTERSGSIFAFPRPRVSAGPNDPRPPANQPPAESSTTLGNPAGTLGPSFQFLRGVLKKPDSRFFNMQTAMQSSPSLAQNKKVSFALPFSRKRNQSTGTLKNAGQPYNSMPTAMESSPSLVASTTTKSSGIVDFLRNRKRSTTKDDFIPTAKELSSSLVNNISTAKESLAIGDFIRNRKRLTPRDDFTPTAMESSSSLANNISTAKKSSAIGDFIRNRKRSTPKEDLIPTAVESSSSLVHNAAKKSGIGDFLRTRKRSTGKDDDFQRAQTALGQLSLPLSDPALTPRTHTSEQSTPISQSTAQNHPRTQSEQYVAGQNRPKEGSDNDVPGMSHEPPMKKVKRRKSLRLPGFKTKKADTKATGQSSTLGSSPRPLNAHAQEFIPQRPIAKSVDFETTLTTTDPTVNPSLGSPTFDTDSVVQGLKEEATYVVTGIHNPTAEPSSPVLPAPPEPASIARPSIETLNSWATKPQIDPKSLYVPPHRRRKPAESGIFLKSTIPFPNTTGDDGPRNDGDSGPKNEPETIQEHSEFNLRPDSKFSVHKNLLKVLWTQAKSQNDTRIQQDIIHCSALENVSQFTPQIYALVSALDSQRYLLALASKLSLAEDAQTHEALVEDRRDIRASLILSQKEILERADDLHCLLDLVQEVLDNSAERLGDTTLHRLIVKLSFSCGKFPSSLFLDGVEKRDHRPFAAGGFGDIHKAEYQSKTVALKQLRFYQNHTDEERGKVREKFCQEALLWKNLNHPFVMPFIGLYSSESDPNRETDQGHYSPLSMVCPWMSNGTILNYLNKSPTTHVDIFLLEIAQGLQYLHSQYIVHGDIRGENILVDDEGHARLADFGLASYANATVKSSARSGSLRWMAPELLDPGCLQLEDFRRTFSTDVYAFACVCYELYTRTHPFAHIQLDPVVIFEIIGGRRPRRVPSIPTQMWELIRACWCQDPRHRLATGDIIEKLEIIQKDRIERTGDESPTAPAEPPQPYKPPQSLGISHNGNSSLSLTRTPSLVVNVLPPNENSRRRNSGFFDLFPAASHSPGPDQMSWRRGTRAISMFFKKATGEGSTASANRTDPSGSRGATGEHMRKRILSLIPRSTPWNST
ncbi:hypothetical protein DFH09DRAFT_1179314 [Mycena vulgaris]|nr:hypothetical protein DFH09DRAFT_1179314 [Mycena vulgaris]